ncbi:MAG: hypothetical protein AAB225_15800 [Acidobacteriota bacterium]
MDLTVYSLTIEPQEPLLGESIVATLRCRSGGPASQALTFDHRSLAVGLSRPGREEPYYAFPNRRVTVQGELLLREASSGGIEDLEPGQERQRSFELRQLYPIQLLDVGCFTLAYTLADETRLIEPPAVTFLIASGLDAVPLLFECLDGEPAVRARSAALLHRMTAQGFDYDPLGEEAARKQAAARWEVWWREEGATLPWNYQADGATFGQPAPAAPPERRGARLGGVIFERASLVPDQRSALVAALADWSKNGAAQSLRGERWVGDWVFAYPPARAAIAPDPEVQTALVAALEKLAESAPSEADHAPAATLILSTVARMPAKAFVAALSAFARAAPEGPEWAGPRSLAAGLLDLLDPQRVPLAYLEARR